MPTGTGRFVLHFFEMCVPMCLGFVVGDAAYFAVAGALGYSDPFSELPVLSLALVTVFMTAPMVAWMRFRGMPPRTVAEMSASMIALALALLVSGWLGLVPMGDLALLEHGAMMPAMLIPMLLRPRVYAGGMHH